MRSRRGEAARILWVAGMSNLFADEVANIKHYGHVDFGVRRSGGIST